MRDAKVAYVVRRVLLRLRPDAFARLPRPECRQSVEAIATHSARRSAADFWKFFRAGREFADLHIGYESAPLHPVAFDLAKPFEQFAPADYRVTQMKFAKGMGGAKHDTTTVIYNYNVTTKNIPLEAYDYVVIGKSALEWGIECQAVTTHKVSGIVALTIREDG